MNAKHLLPAAAALVLSSLALFANSPATTDESQANAPAAAPVSARLDHATLVVRDLGQSAAFYEKVLGLQRMKPRPTNDVIWINAGGLLELHLLQGAPMPQSTEVGVHLAFSVHDMDAFVAHLKRARVKFRNANNNDPVPAPRVDGVLQIYFRDPDGYWIEVNNVKH